MKKHLFKRSLALFIALLMAFGMLPGAALAAEGSVTVTVAATDYNGGDPYFVMMPTTITVPEGKAAEYGYQNAAPGLVVGGNNHGINAGQISSLDALFAAHEQVYGSAFSASTRGDYIGGSSSFLTKMFGTPGHIVFAVNEKTPMGDKTDGYAVNECVIQDGDLIVFQLIDFDEFWGMDFLAYFNTRALSVDAGEDFSLTLNGMSPMELLMGNPGTPSSDPDIYPLSDMQIATVNPSTGILTALPCYTNSTGKATLSFEDPGTYYISALGMFEYWGMDVPVNLPYCEVTVTGGGAPVPSNAAPVIKADIVNPAAAAVTRGSAWTINLADIFEDADGDTLSYTVSVNGSAAEATDGTFVYTPASVGTTTFAFTANDGESDSEDYTVTLTAKNPTSVLTITAPNGAAVKVFKQNRYHSISALTAEYSQDLGDGRTEYGFPAGGTFYRVSMDNKITQTRYTGSGTYEIAFEESENPKTQENINTASMLLRMESSTMVNVNANNHKTMTVGETFRLRGYRCSWEIVNGDTMNMIIQPDFNVNILAGADLISVAAVTDQSNWFDITALGTGTVILEVGYDAIRNVNGTADNLYGATNPDRTSVVVITIGEDSGSVSFGNWDTEFDTVYYLNTESNGIFPLEAGGVQAVSVASVKNGVIGSWQNVTANGDAYNVPVAAGNNVVKAVDAAGNVSYMVVRGAQITPVITNTTTPGAQIGPGDKFTLRFEGLFMPLPKMGNVYNPGLGNGIRITYKLEDTSATAARQYTFINEHAMTFTAPAEDGYYTISEGVLNTWMYAFVDFGAHRNTGDDGTAYGGIAPQYSRVSSILPEILIKVGNPVESGNTDYTVALTTGDEHVNKGDAVTVDVTVSGGEKFNYLGATVLFDAAALAFKENSSAMPNAQVDVKTGQIVITSFSANCSTADGPFVAATLVFEVISATDKALEFSVSAENLEVGDSPEQGYTAEPGEPVSVTLHNVTVTFEAGEGVDLADGTAYAKYNESGLYTSADYDAEYIIPTPAAQAGYELMSPVWFDGLNGLTNAQIKDNAFAENATMTARAVKVWSVSFYNADGSQIDMAQTVYGGQFATAPADLTAPEGQEFAGWFIVTNADDTYISSGTIYTKAQIDALAVSADVMYKAYFKGSSYDFIYDEDMVRIISGVPDGKATNGIDAAFELIDVSADDGYVYVVSYAVGNGEETVLTAAEGKYTVPGSAITGKVTVSVFRAVDGIVEFIEFDEYLGAPTGFKVALLTVGHNPAAGDAFFYEDNAMYWSEKYGAYAYFVDEDVTDVDVLRTVTLKTGSNDEVAYDGDVNQNGYTTMQDAEFVSRIYNNEYLDGFGVLDMLMRLEADVNGDGVVDLSDAHAIRIIYVASIG